jgi:hypothetical protein
MAYSGSLTVSTNQTVNAIAVTTGGNSTIATAAFSITLTAAAAPTFNPTAGLYTAAQQVALSSATQGASIYYTTDGTMPTATAAELYSTPIQVGSGTTTITAIAVVGSDTSSPASATYTVNVGPSYGGTVMSGTLPVVGATVNMYAVGNTGYASPATLLTSTAATTGADGTFTFNYSCPGAGGDLAYIVATAGHAGSNTASNAGLSFMAALSACSSGTLPKPLVVNEATTVASVYALSQFMSGATNVGSSASNYEQSGSSLPGLSNAFAAVNNLVDLTTGIVPTYTPGYGQTLADDTNILNNSTVPHQFPPSERSACARSCTCHSAPEDRPTACRNESPTALRLQNGGYLPQDGLPCRFAPATATRSDATAAPSTHNANYPSTHRNKSSFFA